MTPSAKDGAGTEEKSMAIIPQAAHQPTVDAIYRAYEDQADPGDRAHLGASIIGRECSRELFYTFRWASIVRHSGRMLRLFERGQREESVFVANLRSIGITVHDVDPNTGEQFRFTDIGGHVGGSMDAAALGILEAPKTWHCCEFKTHNAKSYALLVKEGVEKAKPEHAAQMQLYMHWSGMTRAFYLAVNKDTDELYSERLQANPAIAQSLIEKARRIITTNTPPTRLSERPDWYACKWCQHHAVCHQKAIPQVNCRTCCHSTPEMDGHARWSCARFGRDISIENQRKSRQCPAHVFMPSMMPWEAVDSDPGKGTVTYRKEDGTVLVNGPGGAASVEIEKR